MMTYEQCLSAIEDRQRFSGAAGLERIARLLRRLGDPQQRLRCIHIAGTNGKGSVSAMTASVLQKSGFRTGLFTSPHLLDFRERMRVNGRMIPKEELCRHAERVLTAEAELEREEFEPANEFEIITAIAFCFFAAAGCDYVVLECGLGGRCDATNVIEKPAVACITSVSFDHTAQLGDTLVQIASEKCGIIKPGCMVVTPCTQAPDALRTTRFSCVHRGAGLRVTSLPEILRADAFGSDIRYDGELELHVPPLSCAVCSVFRMRSSRPALPPRAGRGGCSLSRPTRSSSLTPGTIKAASTRSAPGSIRSSAAAPSRPLWA